MLEVYSQNYLLRCTARIKRFAKSTCEEYLSNGLRTADHNGFYSKLIFCNKQFRQFRTPLMRDILDCEQSLFSQSSLSSAGLHGESEMAERETGERREEERLHSLL